MYLLQPSGGLVNVSVLGIVLILSFLFFYHIGIVFFYLVLSMGLCLAHRELLLHLDFATLFDHFYFNAAFSVLTVLSCVILILCLVGHFTPILECSHSLHVC